MGFGAVLAVVGAILEFAISASAKGFNINTIGLILLIAGIVAFIIGLGLAVAGGSRRSVLHEDVRTGPNGQERVVEQRDNLAP
jgi:hypothetical protein